MAGWRLAWACRSRPIVAETQSGDACLVAPFPDGELLAAVDGLGHGPEAATAAQKALATLRARPSLPPAEQIGRCHTDLRGTRGAAMLVLSVSYPDARLAWAGIGNVEGWLVTASAREALISRAGVVGYQIGTVRERVAAIAAGDLIALATDGISPRFSNDLERDADPEALADQILAVHGRTTDDALVLVARCEGPS